VLHAGNAFERGHARIWTRGHDDDMTAPYIHRSMLTNRNSP
jgi:hypothetical protein